MKHEEHMAERAARDPEYKKACEEMKPLLDFSLEITVKRNELGLSQTQLAKKIGTSQDIISQLEDGERKPSGDILMKLSKILGITFVITDGVIKIKDTRAA